MLGYQQAKDKQLKRLRRVETQFRSIDKMVDEPGPGSTSSRRSPRRPRRHTDVALGLLDEHVANHVVSAVAAGGQESERALQEASDAIARLARG